MSLVAVEIEIVELMALLVATTVLHVSWLVYRVFCAASFERLEQLHVDVLGEEEELW